MMTFLMEWWLAVHRAVWFPALWATGLDRPGVEVNDYGLADNVSEVSPRCPAPRRRRHSRSRVTAGAN